MNLIHLIALAAAATVGSPAPQLTLQDQFEKEFRLTDLRGEPALIVCGDRTGSEFNGNWAQPVRDKFASLKILHVANLEAVPSFLQGMVRNRFAQPNQDGSAKKPVLLDWDGEIRRLFGFKDGLTNVYLIDGAGVLQFSAAGKGAPEEVAPLIETISHITRTKQLGGRNDR